jgi:hypothetical protein
VDRESKHLAVMLGNGAGGFRAAPGSPVKAGGDPSAVATAELNGDGKADLVFANAASNDVIVLLGDGAGRFSAAPGSPVRVAGTPVDVLAAEVSGDGKVDLVVRALRNLVMVLLGDGSGRFGPAPGSPIAVGTDLSALAVADLNRDGKADLAVSDSKQVSLLLGTGAGRFGAATTVLAALGPDFGFVHVADLNRDAAPDIAVTRVAANGIATQLAVLLGDGAGRFRQAAGSPMSLEPGHDFFGAVAELNGDQNLDLAIASRSSNHVKVLLGNGVGGFRPAADSPFAAPSSPLSIAVADLNGDGKPDLALPDGSGTLTILFQTPSTPVAVPGRKLPGRPDAVFSTRWQITELAADGNRVAVITDPRPGAPGPRTGIACGRVVVWTAPGRKSTSFKPGHLGCEGDGLGDLAVGGGQVAWIERGGGNFLELKVMVANLSGRAPRLVDEAVNGARAAGNASGQWVGHLLGGGPLLAYNSWSVVCDLPPDHGCAPDRPSEFHLADHRLVRISAGRRLGVKSGPASYPLSAVGGGRMAVESAGAVTVLAANGSAVASVPSVEGNPPRAIALSRTRLAVARTFTLDLYDPATGTAAKSISLGPAAALELVGVNSRLALLRGPRRLVLVRLSDGKLISFPLRSAAKTNVIGAALTEAGVFYAYNTPRASAKGRIVFEPTAKLLARF